MKAICDFECCVVRVLKSSPSKTRLTALRFPPFTAKARTGAYSQTFPKIRDRREVIMKHIQTLNTQILQNTVKKGGCGECQTSCQSACKTSCTVGNQTCEHHK